VSTASAGKIQTYLTVYSSCATARCENTNRALIPRAAHLTPHTTAHFAIQGVDSEGCLHSQVRAVYVGEKPLRLDPDRPEYHRGLLCLSTGASGGFEVTSTGEQRSSRLLRYVSGATCANGASSVWRTLTTSTPTFPPPTAWAPPMH
jgi:hypothetical protein